MTAAPLTGAFTFCVCGHTKRRHDDGEGGCQSLVCGCGEFREDAEADTVVEPSAVADDLSAAADVVQAVAPVAVVRLDGEVIAAQPIVAPLDEDGSCSVTIKLPDGTSAEGQVDPGLIPIPDFETDNGIVFRGNYFDPRPAVDGPVFWAGGGSGPVADADQVVAARALVVRVLDSTGSDAVRAQARVCLGALDELGFLLAKDAEHAELRAEIAQLEARIAELRARIDGPVIDAAEDLPVRELRPIPQGSRWRCPEPGCEALFVKPQGVGPHRAKVHGYRRVKS